MSVTGKTAAIEDALNYHLSTLTTSCRFAWPRRQFTPVVGETYLEPGFLPNRTDYAAVGANSPRRHRGLYQVGVVYPLDEGEIPAAEIADEIIEHFEAQSITRNGVTVRVGAFDGSGGLPYRSASINRDGWSVLNVTIPWWCDTF